MFLPIIKQTAQLFSKRFSFQILYFQNWSMYCSHIINLEGTGREQGWLLGGLSGGWQSPAQKRGPSCPCRWPGPGRGQTSAWTRCPAPPGARTCPYWPGARPPSWPGSLQMSSRGGFASKQDSLMWKVNLQNLISAHLQFLSKCSKSQTSVWGLKMSSCC